MSYNKKKIAITEADKKLVQQIVAKVMLESNCREPDYKKDCSHCLHENSENCPLNPREMFVNSILKKGICEHYERRYKPCGTCKYHKNLICRNPRSGCCGSYAYYHEGCPWHVDR